MIKCDFCKNQIEGIDYVTKNKKRYHSQCYAGMIDSAEQKNGQKATALQAGDKGELLAYICKLYDIAEVSHTVDKQIEDFVHFKGYSYSGIQKTLYYFYELEGNKVLDEFKDTIGIVPHCYDKARKFFESVFIANKANESFVPQETNVHVKITPKPRGIPCIIDINEL